MGAALMAAIAALTEKYPKTTALALLVLWGLGSGIAS